MPVKTMTAQEFFDRCDQPHRAFFGDLIARWRQAGWVVKMGPSAAALLAGKTILCSLYPSYRKKGGAVRFNLTSLKRAFGAEWTKSLAADLEGIQELNVSSGTRDLTVWAPAETDLGTHEALKQLLLRRG